MLHAQRLAELRHHGPRHGNLEMGHSMHTCTQLNPMCIGNVLDFGSLSPDARPMGVNRARGDPGETELTAIKLKQLRDASMCSSLMSLDG